MGVKIIKKQQAVGTVEVDGKTKETEVVEEFETDTPLANVGMKLGHTKNMGDYESVRIDVSLYMPSETDKKSLDKTFKKVFKWCDKKLASVVEKLEE